MMIRNPIYPKERRTVAHKFPIDWTAATLIPAKCAVCGASIAAIFAPGNILITALICTSRQHRIDLLNLTPHTPPPPSPPPQEDPTDFPPPPHGKNETSTPDTET